MIRITELDDHKLSEDHIVEHIKEMENHYEEISTKARELLPKLKVEKGLERANSASLSSVREFIYFCKCILMRASKYTLRCLLPLPNTIHSLFSKSISDWFSFTSSPTRIPVEHKRSIIARSRGLTQ